MPEATPFEVAGGPSNLLVEQAHAAKQGNASREETIQSILEKSPLGRDPEPEVKTPPPTPEPQEQFEGIEGLLTPEEFASLSKADLAKTMAERFSARFEEASKNSPLPEDVQAKLNAYQAILNRPDLRQAIADTLVKRGAESSNETQKGYQLPPDIQAKLDKLDKIESKLEEVDAINTINRFKEKTPDFEEHRKTMASLIKDNPRLTLDNAYQLAKAQAMTKNGARPASSERQGLVQAKSGRTALETISNEVMDRKRFPRTGDALDYIIKAAASGEIELE